MATAGKSVVTDDGNRGVLSSGASAVFDAADECAECCASPCSDCTGTQPDADVTTTGSGGCALDDTYEFNYFNDFGSFCQWRFDEPINGAILWIYYCPASGKYCAWLRDGRGSVTYGRDVNDCPCATEPATELADGAITCVAGNLVTAPSFTIAGDGSCSSYTATITLGP